MKVKPIKIENFEQGYQLVLQEEPVRLLYVLKNGELVTSKIFKHINISYDKGERFLDNTFDGKELMLLGYTNEIVEKVKEKLIEVTTIKKESKLAEAIEIVNAIEEDFSDRSGLDQEWQAIFGANERDMLKTLWASKIDKTIDLSQVEEAVNEIPLLIKDEMTKYRGMRNQWDSIDEDIIEEIIETWGEIVRSVLENEG